MRRARGSPKGGVIVRIARRRVKRRRPAAALPARRRLWKNPRRWLRRKVVIDPDGYRPNVGIILLRETDSVFWARRAYRDGWQFPQGGMHSDETPLEAMYRELREETGLRARTRRGASAPRRLAALPVAAAIRSAQRAAGLHRPETGVVPAALSRRRIAAAAGFDRQARVRLVALGRFLVSGCARRRLQARGVRARAAPPGASGWCRSGRGRCGRRNRRDR